MSARNQGNYTIFVGLKYDDKKVSFNIKILINKEYAHSFVTPDVCVHCPFYCEGGTSQSFRESHMVRNHQDGYPYLNLS